MKKFIPTLLACCLFVLSSCSKKENPVADPCAGKVITITETVTPTSGGTSTNGIIAVTAAGSTGFSYSINNGAFAGTNTFTNLAVGTYAVTVKDLNGCTAIKNIQVTSNSCPVITITATTNNTTSPTATNGSIVATATGSTGFTYSINGAAFQASGSFTGLAVGSYVISVKDANGCTGTNTFSITAASCPTITVTAVVTNTSGPTVSNGGLNATATGGVAPYTYSINAGTTFVSSGNFTNLAVGNYNIIAKDANGCIGNSGTLTVSSAPCPTIAISTSVVGTDKCSNNTGVVTVTASGSTGLQYSINGVSFQSSNFFNALAMGTYTITVRDLNGCTNTASATVTVRPPGANFAAVKAVLASNCAIPGCHAGASPQNGLNFSDDCTIVAQSARIKARAVDANPSIMPPFGTISTADKQKIVDWINAGATYSN